MVWLGEDEDGRENATKRLNECRHSPLVTLRDTAIKLREISSVFRNEWFKRLWVVQELVMATGITKVIDNSSAPMDARIWVLKELSGFWTHQHPLPVNHSVNLIVMYDIRRDMRRATHRSKAPYILELLRNTERFRMSDSKDRFYALYELTGDIGFPPNYNCDCHHNDMLRDFAVWALGKYPGLALLSYARGVDARRKCLGTSWVPCFDMDGLPISIVSTPHFTACGCWPNPKFEICGTSKLRILGAIVDTIKSVNADGSNLSDPNAQSKSLRQRCNVCRVLDRSFTDKLDAVSLLLSLLTTFRLGSTERLARYAGIATSGDQFCIFRERIVYLTFSARTLVVYTHRSASAGFKA